MSGTATIETIETVGELEPLPEFTLIVSKPKLVDGKTICISMQKIDGGWYTPGTTWPVNPADLTEEFWPAKVVFQL